MHLFRCSALAGGRNVVLLASFATGLSSFSLAQSGAATATTLAAAPNPVGYNQPVLLSAGVTETNGNATPTGTVTFAAYGRTLATVSLNSSGVAYLNATANYSPGTYAVTATYNGDSKNQVSTSSPYDVSILYVPTTTLAITPNAIVAGATTNVTITVMGAGPTPTGTVTLQDGRTVLATVSLSSGVASFAASSAGYPVGNYPLTASYSGDAHYLPSTSPTENVLLMPKQTTATAAARFLDQSSFGPTAAGIAHVQQIGLAAAITEQFGEATTLFSEPPLNDAECPNSNWNCTQSEYLNVSAFGNDQLRQRIALALSELWVAPQHTDNAMPFYLNTLANDAFTNYRTIMNDGALSPAMGDYLNMVNSGKPPAGQIANENFGREMMQLFTLGPNLLNSDGTDQLDANGNPIPTYTEAQVQAFALAYTGWTYANSDGTTPSSFNYTKNWLYLMVPVESKHDMTAKTLLNGTTLPSGQTAEQDLKGALDNIFQHDNIGPFISRHLIQCLVSGNPSAGYVQRVAAVFANNGKGTRGDMQAVITAILMDEEARAGDLQTGNQAESSPSVNGGHLREPLLWTANLIRGLSAVQTTPSDPYPFVSFMSGNVGSMGEAPFNQQSVFNYYSPYYVIPDGDYASGEAPAIGANAPEFGLENTGSVVPRQSVADYLIHNKLAGMTIDLSTSSAIGQYASNPAQLVSYLSMLFMHNQMPSDMQSVIIDAVTAIPSTDLETRAQVATYLVVTSSQYKIMH
jgi:uncharacterized protein (DUF1800 family)